MGLSQGTSTSQSNQFKSGTGICKEFTPSLCQSLDQADWFSIKGESVCLGPRISGGNTSLIHLGGPEKDFFNKKNSIAKFHGNFNPEHLSSIYLLSF